MVITGKIKRIKSTRWTAKDSVTQFKESRFKAFVTAKITSLRGHKEDCSEEVERKQERKSDDRWWRLEDRF